MNSPKICPWLEKTPGNWPGLGARTESDLIDESSAGLVHEEAEELMELIRAIRDRGITPILIEHNMHVVMNLCDRLGGAGSRRRNRPRPARRNPGQPGRD